MYEMKRTPCWPFAIFVALFHMGTVLSASAPELPNLEWRHLDARHGLPEIASPASMIQDSLGQVWIAYDRGLFCYNGYDIRSYKRDLADSTSIAEDRTLGLHCDPRGRILVGTYNRGFSVLDQETGKFSHHLPLEEGGDYPAKRAFGFYQENDSTIWITSNMGLIRHDPIHNSFEQFVFEADGYPGVDEEWLNSGRTIRPDPADPGKLFIGTRGGLLSFDTRQLRYTHHESPWKPHAQPGQASYRDFMVVDFLFVDSENLWATTWDGGLLHWHIPSGQWDRVFHPPGMPGKVVGYGITRKGPDELWVGSTNGFGVFSLSERSFSIFEHDPQNPFTIRPYPSLWRILITSDSTLLVCGTNGLEVASLSKGQGLHTGLKPFFTRLLVNGESWYPDGNPLELRFDGGDNTLQFQATLPCYHGQDQVEYQFWLEGVDQGWIDNGHQRDIHYTGLRGGNYRMKFRARTAGGEWVEGTDFPEFRISLPFWKRKWVAWGAILLAGSLVYMVYRLRIARMKREHEVQLAFSRKLAEVEMSALRAQMNPHFLFNTLNSIKSYIIRQKTEEAINYLTRFSRLMRAVLNNSKSELISLKEELRALSLYIELEAIRFEGEFDYLIDIEDGLDTEGLQVPPLFIQPYVENAIRHGLREKKTGSKQLMVSVREGDNDHIEITVEDNGIGREKAALKNQAHRNGERSFGMDITGHRIQLMQEQLNITASVDIRDLYASDGSPAGTRVTISLPKVTAHAKQ